MDGAKSNSKLIVWGTFNILSPFPVYMFTGFWTLLVMAIFRFDDSSAVAVIISALPILVCPASCVLGIVCGLKHRNRCRKNAIICMALSAAGLVGFVFLIFVMARLSYMV